MQQARISQKELMTLRAESGGKVFSQPQVARLRREQGLDPVHGVRPLTFSVTDLCDACLLYTSPSPRDS